MTSWWHPRADDAGRPVRILHPSIATPAAAWSDPAAVVVVVPDGDVPAALNGRAFSPWSTVDGDTEDDALPFVEPPFACPVGLAPAAGVVIVEQDRRLWLHCPTNRFGNVDAAVPKGRVDPGATLAASAVRETLEETGLRARLTGFLGDFSRSQTHVRYYVGERIGGDPSQVGWESQGVLLVPVARLPEVLTGPHDAAIVQALQAYLRRGG